MMEDRASKVTLEAFLHLNKDQMFYESRQNRFDMFKTVEIEIDDDSLAYEYFDAV